MTREGHGKKGRRGRRIKIEEGERKHVIKKVRKRAKSEGQKTSHPHRPCNMILFLTFKFKCLL